jgi:hypothetical protein
VSELTLESLAQRVQELERKLAQWTAPPARNWRSVVGLFDDSDFMKQVIAEGQAIREAERQAAREGRFE